MSEYVKKWNSFLAEDQDKYQIFCDMDGVLVNLIEGINTAIYEAPPPGASDRYKKAQTEARESLGGKKLKEEDANKHSEHFKKPVRNFMYRVMSDNRHFWMNLPWQPGGRELWDYIKKYDPIILSRPVDLQSVIGKKKWVKDNLGLTGEKVQIRYNKSPYAKYKGKTGILIDDFESNTSKFDEAGGVTILYKDSTQAIASLKELNF